MSETLREAVINNRVPKSRARTVAWISLLAVIVVAFATVFIPAWLIMPFKGQTPRGVALSYALKSSSPWITLIGSIIAVALIIWLWRGSRLFGRATMLALLIPGLISVWFARQNHFEWMFSPLPNPDYAKAGDADFVKEGDMVLSVVVDGEAVAYPVRQIAYHHIVQDRVGDTHIVATY